MPSVLMPIEPESVEVDEGEADEGGLEGDEEGDEEGCEGETPEDETPAAVRDA
jgi:hypothetical protein